MSEHDRYRERSESRGRGGPRGGGERGPDRGGERENIPTTSLLVRNISYRVRSDELRRLFSRYGEVRDVYIPEVFSFSFQKIENFYI
jgi:RNA recognition motif-containing protein